jgi:hypothetical protein
MFSTEEEKQEFDRFVTRLLALHGVEYVRGYVDALREVQKQASIKWR